MLGLSIPAILRPSTFASSSRLTLPTLSNLRSSGPGSIGAVQSQIQYQQVRFRSQLAPKRTKYRKAQKGRVALPIGGSLKGSTLEHGTYGLRTLAAVRLTADQLTSAQTAIKRKIKAVKGAECFMRVFPDLPVCVKGNETRMGKGKGSFEYWACRVPVGRVVFEIGGGNIREEIAKQALRLAQVKLPVPTEFIHHSAPPRLGAITNSDLTAPMAALPAPAQLVDLDAKNEGRAVGVVLAREERLVDALEAVAAQAGEGSSTAEARA